MRENNMIRGTCLVFGVLLLLSGCGKPAQPPDLTGIWTLDAQGRAGASLNGVGDFEQTAPFTARAREKLAAYHALVDPTGDRLGAAHAAGRRDAGFVLCRTSPLSRPLQRSATSWLKAPLPQPTSSQRNPGCGANQSRKTSPARRLHTPIIRS